MNHIKIVIVGPMECGKSYLSNFLSEAVEQVTGEYRPTCGVRIIEYEMNLPVKNKIFKVDVEIWDVSGNKKYESCWPATFKGAHGAVFVYNPDHADHGKELDYWHSVLVQNTSLKDGNCCLIGHKRPNKNEREACNLPIAFGKFQQLMGNVSEEGDKLRESFGKFIAQLFSNKLEVTEQEELNIINS
ncbi:unnamed protein product [Calicophoron daubneyi]|uniref:Intraflagellar transport protein 22 homolog n=1 Tax=Calicophoron daubneyi TaxID=300641 RepID=A0AAV2TMT6_CALDB